MSERTKRILGTIIGIAAVIILAAMCIHVAQFDIQHFVILNIGWHPMGQLSAFTQFIALALLQLELFFLLCMVIIIFAIHLICGHSEPREKK